MTTLINTIKVLSVCILILGAERVVAQESFNFSHNIDGTTAQYVIDQKLTREDVKGLGKRLETPYTSLSIVCAAGEFLTYKQATYLLKKIEKYQRTLTSLTLQLKGVNWEKSNDFVNQVTPILLNNGGLETVDLSYNLIGESIQDLIVLLAAQKKKLNAFPFPNLRTLNLSGNYLGEIPLFIVDDEFPDSKISLVDLFPDDTKITL